MLHWYSCNFSSKLCITETSWFSCLYFTHFYCHPKLVLCFSFGWSWIFIFCILSMLLCVLWNKDRLLISCIRLSHIWWLILIGTLLSQNKPFCSIYTTFFLGCCTTLLPVIVPIELVYEPYTLFLGILVEKAPLQNSQVFKLWTETSVSYSITSLMDFTGKT